ncbi:MAG: hypothetical protein WB870_14380 [Gallionellaceae bacterium]
MAMSRAQRAMQIWQILVGAAHSRRSYTYGQIASILGMGGAGVMSQFLDPIMRYCKDKGIPPLTVLVVNQDTGLPGDGLTTLNEVNKDREAVFNHDWFGMNPVQIVDFESHA